MFFRGARECHRRRLASREPVDFSVIEPQSTRGRPTLLWRAWLRRPKQAGFWGEAIGTGYRGVYRAAAPLLDDSRRLARAGRPGHDGLTKR
jgi:hypothetical protein